MGAAKDNQTVGKRDDNQNQTNNEYPKIRLAGFFTYPQEQESNQYRNCGNPAVGTKRQLP